MDDSISRQAALDALPKKQNGIGGESWMKTYRRSGYNDCVEDCMKALQALPSAQPGWIPTSERLPENDNDVLVTDGTDCAVAYWRTDAQAWDDSMHGWCDLYGLEVTAWMPLPTPWEGEQDGKG